MPLSRASLMADFSLLLDSYEDSNVIGAKTLDGIVDDHILDSLSCVLFEPLVSAGNLVDVGSGGGLPGLPLGIAVEGLRVCLVEATAKKVAFLGSAATQLGVPNFRILNQRAEELGRSEEFRGSYEVATARALAPLDVLAEYCLPLVKVGGHAIAMKGRVGKDELRRGEYAASVVGGEVSEIIKVSRLPEYEQKQRHLVVFKKTEETPEKYPRRVGLPAKKPLGEMRNP